MKQFVQRTLTERLRARQLVWTPRLRVFCDGGVPRFRWLPRFRRQRYHPHWGMRGLAVLWIGREFNVSIGVDRHGLYARP